MSEVRVRFYKRDNTSVISWVAWLAQSIKLGRPAKYTHVNLVVNNYEYGLYWQSPLLKIEIDHLVPDIEVTVIGVNKHLALDYLQAYISFGTTITWDSLLRYLVNFKSHTCINFVCDVINYDNEWTCDELFTKLCTNPYTYIPKQ